MQNLVRKLIVFLIFVLALPMTACSSSSKADDSNSNQNSTLVGKWFLSGQFGVDIKFSSDDTFYSDYDLFDIGYSGTFELSDNKLTITNSHEDTVTYDFELATDGNSFTLSNSDQTKKFKK